MSAASSMWARFSAQERERSARDYLREHGFYARGLALAEGDPDLERAVVGLAVVGAANALFGGRAGQRQQELLETVSVWPTTAWRHPWLNPGRRLARMLDLIRYRRFSADDVAAFNLAAAMTGSSLRMVDVAADHHDGSAFDARQAVHRARTTEARR